MYIAREGFFAEAFAGKFDHGCHAMFFADLLHFRVSKALRKLGKEGGLGRVQFSGIKHQIIVLTELPISDSSKFTLLVI